MTRPPETGRSTVADPAADEAALRIALQAVGPLDDDAMTAARGHLDQLTKPPGSLGRLEEVLVTIAGITGQARPALERRAIVVAAADHGVTAQGVSAYPSTVTAQMVANFLAGGAAINVLSRTAGASVTILDVGVATPYAVPWMHGSPAAPNDPAAPRHAAHPDDAADGAGADDRGGRLVAAPVRPGTADMTVEPAMSRAEAIAAIAIGQRVMEDLVATGVDLVGIGEMGIGNTTAASAITAVMTGASPAWVTGRGTGIDETTRLQKVAAIERAIARHAPDPRDPIGVAAAVGGLEIAALAGVIIAASAAGVPLVLDGFITGSAALLAVGLQPAIAPRLIASHRSVEPGHAVVLDALSTRPLLDLDLRLGEGTGAALAMLLIGAAGRVRDEMATFASAGVSGPA